MIIDQYTKVYGIVGSPLEHTLSPAMHNAAFNALGINAVYLAFETSDIKASIKGMRALGIKGLSVTIPYKDEVSALLNEIDEDALRLGAVNTIVNTSGRLIGYNTDAAGFLATLGPEEINSFENALIVGAGGAARAVAFSLVENGLPVTITNRSKTRGSALAAEMGCSFLPLDGINHCKADLLINTTPVGMAPKVDDSPVSPEVLRKGMTVMDIIYNPMETRLLYLARTRGCRTISGIQMLVHQGALQFRLWTGLNPPVEVMMEAVRECLNKERPLCDIRDIEGRR